jgi:hypothetical protein
MANTNNILIGVGAVAALGVGVWLLTKKSTTTTTTTTGGGQTDPSTNTVDSLGTTLGNLFSEIFANKTKKDNNTSCNAPADPYSYDGIDKDDYSSSEIEKMQKNLSKKGSEITAIIEGSGGADGVIGPGFKNAYNMARKACLINGVSNLLT